MCCQSFPAALSASHGRPRVLERQRIPRSPFLSWLQTWCSISRQMTSVPANRSQSTVRPLWLLDTETADEEDRTVALLDALEPALDVTGGQLRAHHPSVHILLARQARTHQAFESCNQQLQEAASMSLDGQDCRPMSGVHHRTLRTAEVRWNRRSQLHAVADIGGGERERQD